jgi:RNA 3'-terminal phosphate cyclase (ATP)
LIIARQGPLLRIVGRAVAASLPAHIPQRVADRARSLLAGLGVELPVEPLRAVCPGAGLFLAAEYTDLSCGFSALARLASLPKRSPRKPPKRS